MLFHAFLPLFKPQMITCIRFRTKCCMQKRLIDVFMPQYFSLTA